MTETIEATSSAATAEKSAKTAGKKSGGLSSMLLPELKQLAGSLGIKGAGAMRKSALVDAISAKQAASRSQSDPAPGGDSTTKTSQTVTSSTQGASGELAAAADSAGRPNGAAGLVSGRDQSLSRRDSSQQGQQSRDSGQQSRQSREPGQQDQQDQQHQQSRDSEQQSQQSRDSRQPDQLSRDSRQQNGQDRNRDQAKRDFGQQGQQSRDSEQQGQQSRDSGQQQSRDSGQQQSRDSGQQGQQNRDSGQQANDSNKESLRDDDRGSSRNSRRRNRNRDRDRDRYRDRDVRRREGGGTDAEPQVSDDEVLIPVAGILDLLDNYAFVRTSGYLPGPNDVYVALSMVRKFGLRKGDAVTGAVRQIDGGSSGGGDQRREKFNPIVRIDTVNGTEPEASQGRVEFSKLTPLYAADRLRLETEPNLLIGRLIDIVAPVGKGQRGLIVSPSKAGKTIVLQQIANAITTNNPECHLMVVLVDERPEEVTDMQRAVKGEVIASTFDRPAEDHTTVAELAIERAKRLVELGHDVVVLLDSITRLGRAYNLAAPASGRILSGGVDSSALYPPKRFFGAARNIEDGGSLTILATALIETGSKMDEVIFEEFKGTGNMELRLRREFADKRIFPAIDVDSSGTRREELLMTKDELAIVWKLRRVLSGLDGQQALELVINKLKSTKSNVEFLMQVNKTTATASGIRGQDDD